MLSVGPVVLTIRALTILAWVGVIYDAVPWWPYLPEATSRLLVAAAIVGSCHFLCTWLIAASAKPATEVYEAGRLMGRRQLLEEQASPERVAHLADRRRLREAQDSDAAVGGGRWLH